MKKLYLDWKICDSCLEETEYEEDMVLCRKGEEFRLVKAGTQILALQGDPGDPYYGKTAKKTGFHFIFEGDFPEIPFYSVPYLCLIGRDEKGGFFAVRRRPDPEEWFAGEEEPLYYIPGRRKVYLAAGSLEDLIEGGRAWREDLRLSKKIKLYPSAEAAQKNKPFAGPEILSRFDPGPQDMCLPLPFD